jgi:hypothetical protein
MADLMLPVPCTIVPGFYIYVLVQFGKRPASSADSDQAWENKGQIHTPMDEMNLKKEKLLYVEVPVPLQASAHILLSCPSLYAIPVFGAKPQ